MWAQQATPRIGYVYPAGGKQGSTFHVTVGGQNLLGATNAYVTGGGVEAAVIDYARPLTPKEINALKDELAELQRRQASQASGNDPVGANAGSHSATNRARTAADEVVIAEIRKKLAARGNRNANPAIAETVTIEIRLASDAELGEREIRVGTSLGLSNPLLFLVGQLPEYSEPLAAATTARRERPPDRASRPSTRASEPAAVSVKLPTTINGQILSGDVDRYRFTARQGQHIVATLAGRGLIPYLPDAVPGWFQATLALSDEKGRELAYEDDFRFHPDPVLHFEVPKDGEYVIAVRDALFRGREDFVYRLALGELPFVTSIFPLGGSVDGSQPLELRGWNLPDSSMTPEVDQQRQGVHRLFVQQNGLFSNLVPYVVDAEPECRDEEPNNQLRTAQKLMLPVVVNGRITAPEDVDVFSFDGRAGDAIIADLRARRLGSPLDSYLKLTDAAGRELAFNDDHEDKGSGLTTHHADSWLRLNLPADGRYFVQVGDTQRRGGPEFGYRLRLGQPRPDFELRIVPSSIAVRAGASVSLTIHALRRNGFSRPVDLALLGAAAGFKLTGARVPEGQDQVRLTLTVAANVEQSTCSLRLEGRAIVEGHEIVRSVVPADDMMQAFSYHHLVPAKELMVAIVGRALPMAAVRILGEMPVLIPAGGTVRVSTDAPPRAFTEKVRLELSDPPEGLSLQEVVPSRSGAELVLRCDGAKMKPGLQGNLIVEAFAVGTGAAGENTAKAGRRRAALSTLPAIPFVIVEQLRTDPKRGP